MIKWLHANTIRRKRVLVRVDFNVPVSDGRILDDFRIKAHLPTLKTLLRNRNILILIAHIGRPDGKKIGAMSLRPAARRLSALLGRRVCFVPDPRDAELRKKIKTSAPQSVFLIENVRFWPGEKKNDRAFAKMLADLGEVFVQDAFGVIHRSESSVTGLPRFLPSFGGLLLQKELEALSPLVVKPKHPFVVIMGGAKIETKLPLIKALIKKADRVLLGGSLANTMLASLGFPVGKSKIEQSAVSELRRVAIQDGKLVMPQDVITARSLNDSHPRAKPIKEVSESEFILDIGPETIKAFAAEIKTAKTMLWNGPLGLIEKKQFAKGTLLVAKLFAASRAHKIIGGGDLASVFKKYGISSRNIHVATGGGSALSLIAGNSLPGLSALEHQSK